MSIKHNNESIVMQPTPHAAYIYDKREHKEKCLHDTKMHQEAVKRLMNVIAHEIRCRATYHDYTKFKHETLTFEEHMKIERHHLNMPQGVPDDVNVIDLVEFICDCISAGAQRSGALDFRYLEVDKELLRPIINNTAIDLWKMIIINDEGE